MRVKQPEPFDPNREYSPGERCVRCKIKREDCPGIGRQCDKYHRSDRKTIYWRLLRIAGGFKGVETLEFNYNGTIAGVKVGSRPG